MTVRWLSGRAGQLIRAHPVVFAVLAIWAFAPLVALAVYVIVHGGVMTGANGNDAFDQTAYLAWIRDAGSHWLASDLWSVGGTSHDYLHPMFAISSLLWRLGVGIQLSYLVWKPVALLVLFLGTAAYVRRLIPGHPRAASSALVLGLFYVTPVLAVAVWTGHLSPQHRFDMLLVTDDADAALSLWGFDHAAITVGCMSIFLLAVERLLRPERTSRSSQALLTGVAFVSGLLPSWLRPWQGLTLICVLGGLVVFQGPRRRYVKLAIPLAGLVLPLVYGFVLSRSDPVWREFQARTIGTGTAPWWALLASFGPVGLFAALGVRRPRADAEWMLVLWVAACAGVYFLVKEFPPHALTGVTVPLAVLAVRGWLRVVRLQGRIAPAVALAAILAFTVPEVIYHAQALRHDLGNTAAGAASRQLEVLSTDQGAALAYLDRSARSGAVLAPWFLSMSVPELTGRRAYAGHIMWQPGSQVAAAGLFYAPTLHDPTGAMRRSILLRSGARFVVADCGAPAALAQAIAPMVEGIRRFGCVTVYATT